MAEDRYLRSVLTVIAAALVYLCAVLTPWPGVRAQATQPPLVRPGEITGPMPVVVTGWRAAEVVPVAVSNKVVPVVVSNTVQVIGRVTTERSDGRADRVVLVGWEDRGDPARSAREFRPFDSARGTGLPTSGAPR